MDFIFHGLAGLVVSKTLTGDYHSSALLFSVLPDIGALTNVYSHIKQSSKKSIKQFRKDIVNISRRGKFLNSFDKNIYRSTHSLISLIPISIITFILFENIWWMLTLAYLSHLIIDAFTHDKEASFHPFWPFSKFALGGKSYINKKVFLSMWIALITITLFQSLIDRI